MPGVRCVCGGEAGAGVVSGDFRHDFQFFFSCSYFVFMRNRLEYNFV